MPLSRYLLLLIFTISFYAAHGQQDVDLHLNNTFLSGKNILKVTRDFHDPYLWVLAQNNEVYRINSVTYAIDNYTSKFAAYSELQFIDIAGRSQDTMFIATNSDKIIEYKQGTALKVITAADGIVGTVNSIGMDYTGTYLTDNTLGYGGHLDGNTILIATNTGMCHYDYKLGIILPYPSHVPARVFEATYRTEMFSNLEFTGYPDPALQYSVVALTHQTVFAGFIYYGSYGNYGNNINTAYYTTGAFYPDDYYYYNLPNTLFSNYYWGTDNGVFQTLWSQSRSSAGPQKHYLDGIKTNKITSIYGVTAFGPIQYGSFIKENILAGTDNGLYFSSSGYANPVVGVLNKNTFYHYDPLGNIKINDICVNATSYNKPVCEDGIWVATVNGLYLLKPDYVPYIDQTQQISSAILFDNYSFDKQELNFCGNVAAKASVFTPNYRGNTIQWYKDGQELPNESGNTLNITAAGDYYAVFYDPCSPTHFETNHLKVTNTPEPVFTFNYLDEMNFCEGSTATLKTENNPDYQYRWYKNGVLNGNTTATLNTTEAGVYKLEVSACTDNWVSSKNVKINFIQIPQPLLTTDKPAYCIGDNALLSINFINNGTFTVNWFKNGIALTGNQNHTSLLTNEPGSYTANISSNLITCDKTSAPVPLNFEAHPTLILEQLTNTPLCDGKTISLKASYSGNSVKWSTGQTTDQITITQSGAYSATTTTTGGCPETQFIDIQFFQNPVVNLPDASLCQFTNETVTLTAPAGFAKYEWNGQPGNENFIVSKTGTITLTVTDNNGCQGTQVINISGHCNDIHLPNTFTPNGDGTNDTWVITGIENDPSVIVRIYNRSGSLVFQKSGYYTPWDGRYNGKKLPAGVYYYIINTQQGSRPISGNLTLLY